MKITFKIDIIFTVVIVISGIILQPGFGEETQLKSSECGPGTFLNETMGVCQIIDNGCDPNSIYDYDCGVAKESIFMDGGFGLTITILIFTIPIVLMILAIIMWVKK